MTDRASDQQVDIEQALAEHFRVWSMTGPFTGEPKCGTDGEPWPCSHWQAIARQAAIGAAVEAIPVGHWLHLLREPNGWWKAAIESTSAPRTYVSARLTDPDAAIAAALEDDR